MVITPVFIFKNYGAPTVKQRKSCKPVMAHYGLSQLITHQLQTTRLDDPRLCTLPKAQHLRVEVENAATYAVLKDRYGQLALAVSESESS